MAKHRLRRGAILFATMAGVLLAGMSPASAAPFAGSAYALELSGPVPLGPLAESSSEGPESNSLVSSPLGSLGSVGLLETSSTKDRESGTVHSEATTADVTLNGILSAEAITAECTSTYETGKPTGSIALVGLDIGNGQSVPAEFKPNFSLGIPGVAEVIFNEQIRQSDGTLTVNAVHVKTVLGVDLVISSATCGLPCPPIPLASGDGLLLALGVLTVAGIPFGARFVRRRRGARPLAG